MNTQNSKLIGYMRVSKADGSQVCDLQRDALIAAGVASENIFEDHISGKQNDRPGLNKCLSSLQSLDTLVVWKLDRLGRSLRHLVNIVEELRQRNVAFKVLTGQGAQIDTTTSHGRLVFGMFAALAEFERELIVERTNAGLAAARTRGRIGGRPRKMDIMKIKMASAAMSDPHAKAEDVAKSLNITTTTLYMYINGDGSLKEEAKKIINP
jgi:DNA invertase Pin-like site-specific DNA recombinase